jgi:hypothetical protein
MGIPIGLLMNKWLLILASLVLINFNHGAFALTSFSSASKEVYISTYLDTLVAKPSSIKKTLSFNDKQRLANYETNYLKEYQQLIKNQSPYRIMYVQPVNKVEDCKVWVVGRSDFIEIAPIGQAYYWDGQCKNGYADGLGREFLMDERFNKWTLAVYKDAMPTYFIEQDSISRTYIEGLFDSRRLTWLGVTKYYLDSYVMTQIGLQNYATQINLIEHSFSDENSTRILLKEYPNFKYKSFEYPLDSLTSVDYEFALYDENNVRNGWGFFKSKNSEYYGSFEYIDDRPYLIPLPIEFRRKYTYIMDEIYWAGRQALKAQKHALKIKQDYIEKVCSNPSTSMMKLIPSYSNICSSEHDLLMNAR